MIVIDTSAVIEALAGLDPDPRLKRRLSGARGRHAPHLIDVEVLSGLRGLVRGSKLTRDRATDIRRDFADLRIIRYPIAGIAERVWDLRDAMTCYDACYVALAESLGCPLVTTDGRLGRSTGHRATVELYPATGG
ncbi:MAG: type II toxin-antitoxin system VapC family toxin [Micromonosporaceae bacterium]